MDELYGPLALAWKLNANEEASISSPVHAAHKVRSVHQCEFLYAVDIPRLARTSG